MPRGSASLAKKNSVSTMAILFPFVATRCKVPSSPEDAPAKSDHENATAPMAPMVLVEHNEARSNHG